MIKKLKKLKQKKATKARQIGPLECVKQKKNDIKILCT